MKLHIFFRAVLFLLLLISPGRTLAQQTTTFTYQGQLRDGGANANGNYTLTFKLYDAPAGGAQAGETVTAVNHPIVNGVFSVNLDFGEGAFNGTGRWLDITVKHGVSEPQTLSPRERLLPVPYALYAPVATNAVAATHIQSSAIATTNIQNSAVTAPKIAAGQVVKSINGHTDGVTLVGGENVILTPFGNILEISAESGIYTAVPGSQVFNEDGTFIVPGGVSRIVVELWGGGGKGGAGGSGNVLLSVHGADGGGGGGGGYAKGILNVTPGQELAVTVGAGGGIAANGGTSSIGSISATGGHGGGGGSDAFSEGWQVGKGGFGGTGAGAPITIPGQFGQSGFNPGQAGTGFGGNAGGGGGFGGNPGGVNSPGGGGSGGKGQIGAGNAGTAGARGRVIVWWAWVNNQ